MADFMDFNAWRDLATASEQEVLDRQLSDVEARTREANQALSRAQRDAQIQRLKETQGAGVATTTLSSVGSYADYLKAKQAQQNAAAALRGGRIGELGDVRMTASGDYLKQAGGMSEQLGSREQRIGAEDASGLAGANRLADERRAREAAAAEAAANRKKTDDDYRASTQAAIDERLRQGRELTYEQVMAGHSTYNPQMWSQMKVANALRGGTDFDPFSKEGRKLRSAAFDPNASAEGRGNVFNPWGYQNRDKQPDKYLTESERRWGGYKK